MPDVGKPVDGNPVALALCKFKFVAFRLAAAAAGVASDKDEKESEFAKMEFPVGSSFGCAMEVAMTFDSLFGVRLLW